MNKKSWIIILVVGLLVLGLISYEVANSAKKQLIIENKTQQRKISLPIPKDKSLEVSYIHSLYGGIQIEHFQIGEDKLLYLEEMRFENYDALLYYVCFSVEQDNYKEPYWILDSDYVTDSVNFLVPMPQRDFKICLSNCVLKCEEIGNWGDIIKIYVQ